MVDALVEEGRLTEEEARAHPHRMLLNQALAANGTTEADVQVFAVEPGDRLALTSDGVHGVLDPEPLADLMSLDADVDAVVSRIADAVEDAGAPDNYSVVLVEVVA